MVKVRENLGICEWDDFDRHSWCPLCKEKTGWRSYIVYHIILKTGNYEKIKTHICPEIFHIFAIISDQYKAIHREKKSMHNLKSIKI